MQGFKNKFALITGGTNGMGFATVQHFINEGGNVIITGNLIHTRNGISSGQLSGNDTYAARRNIRYRFTK